MQLVIFLIFNKFSLFFVVVVVVALALKWKTGSPRDATSRNLWQISCQTIHAVKDRTFYLWLSMVTTIMWLSWPLEKSRDCLVTPHKFPGESPSSSGFRLRSRTQPWMSTILPVVENVRLTPNNKPCFWNFHPTSKIWLLPNANILIDYIISCGFLSWRSSSPEWKEN